MEGLVGSFGTLLVALLAILPGVPGEKVYSWMIGRSWLEKDFEYAIRVLAFSVTGLLTYSIVATWFEWPAPVHVLPATYEGAGLTAEDLPRLGVGYFGHITGSALVGAMVGIIHVLVRTCIPGVYGRHRDTWDQFVRTHAQKRWLVVTLKEGTSYVGILEQADISREPEFRDIVLKEPAIWDEKESNYRATSQQYFYLKGDQIASLSAVTDATSDSRITCIGEFIFPKEESNEQGQAQAQTQAQTQAITIEAR